MKTLIVMLASLLAVWPTRAEIIVLDKSRPPQTEEEFSYQHPALSSLFFVSPQTRRIAMLPANEYYVELADPLWRAPGLLPPYAPPRPSEGVGTSVLPSARDSVTYTLHRAHAFSANLYDRDNLFLMGNARSIMFQPGIVPYAGYYRYGVAYPPPQPPGFNQPPRPSARDSATYVLERAHRFSQDAYRKP